MEHVCFFSVNALTYAFGITIIGPQVEGATYNQFRPNSQFASQIFFHDMGLSASNNQTQGTDTASQTLSYSVVLETHLAVTCSSKS